MVLAAEQRELGSFTPLNDFFAGAEQSYSSHTGTTAYKYGTGGSELPAMEHSTAGPYWQSILAFVVRAAD